MPRPKKSVDPKVPAPVAVAPPQPMMPAGIPNQGAPPVIGHQQFQQVLPNQLQQHLPPPPPPQAGVVGAPPRVVLNEHFLSVRDSVSSQFQVHSHCDSTLS